MFLSPILAAETTRIMGLEWKGPITVLGLVGVAFWGIRFLHQWLVSEYKKESVIPVMFWYWSILGTICLGIYFIVTREPIGILSYVPNAVVYIRNLMLIHRKRRADGKKPLSRTPPPPPADPPPARPER